MRMLQLVKLLDRTHCSRKGYKELVRARNSIFSNSQKAEMKLVFQEVCFRLVILEFLGRVFKEKTNSQHLNSDR